MTSWIYVSPHRKELPRLSTEKKGDHLKKLFWVKYENVAQVLIIHYKLDYLIGMLLPLIVCEVSVWKFFAFEEHLDDPEKFVARIQIRFFDLIPMLSVHALHGQYIFTCQSSHLRVPFSVDFLIAFLIFHVLVHHFKYLLTTAIPVGLRRVKIQKRAHHTICATKHL